jgi:glucose-1-phosphate adenylyltransferase
MELLGKEPAFDIRGTGRDKIYARNNAMPSSYVDAKAKTVNCFIAEGSDIFGTVKHSIISTGCYVGEGATIEDSVLMPGTVIEKGAIVRHAILGENTRVCANAVVGGTFAPGEEKQISVTQKNAIVPANSVLFPGEML